MDKCYGDAGDCREVSSALIILPGTCWKGSRMDEEWLTYAEAAERLNIKPDSVKRRARARKWPRRTGNDGLARVRIETPEGLEEASSPENPPVSALLLAAETEVRLLRERVADLTADRDALREALARAAERKPGFLARFLGR